MSESALRELIIENLGDKDIADKIINYGTLIGFPVKKEDTYE